MRRTSLAIEAPTTERERYLRALVQRLGITPAEAEARWAEHQRRVRAATKRRRS